jgi:hypothetical protein
MHDTQAVALFQCHFSAPPNLISSSVAFAAAMEFID